MNSHPATPPAVPRWTAAVLCILYGFAKINGSQFTILDSELTRPLGEVSGFWLTWHYFGYSAAYGTLLAIVQICAGILLVLPRTSLAGALMMLPIAVNIVLVDIFYGVDLGGTVAALVLCGCLAATIRPFVKRLSAAILLEAQPGRPAAATLLALAVVLSGSFALTWWVAHYNNRAPTVIDGTWTVTAQSGTAPEVPQWQRVYFEHNRAHLVVFRAAGHPDRSHHFEVDADGVILVWELWLTKGALIMQGRMHSDTHIELELGSGGEGGRIVLERNGRM